MNSNSDYWNKQILARFDEWANDQKKKAGLDVEMDERYLRKLTNKRYDLAKALYGDTNWEFISSYTKDYWLKKAEIAMSFFSIQGV